MEKEAIKEAGLKHCDFIDEYPALNNPLFSFNQGIKWQLQQQDKFAIGFVKWVQINCTDIEILEKGEIYYFYNNSTWKTPEQLLEIYKQQLPK